MKKENQKIFRKAIVMLILFVLWTLAVRFVDVRNIGPQGSAVGLSTINAIVQDITGVNMSIYALTDWLGLVPFGFIFGFALLGLVQLIKRKNILKVDYNILVLGGFYIIVMALYILFEIFVVNYRPVLIEGVLEASYPSSTTTLVMCVIPTAVMQFNVRIKNTLLRRSVAFVLWVFVIFMVGARLISGVHWFSDILGGIFLSSGLVKLYYFVSGLNSISKQNK